MRRARSLRRTFLSALIGFGALFSLVFASVSVYRIQSDLREQLLRRGEGLVADLARETVRFLGEKDPLKRELSLMLLTHRVTVGDVVYAQVVKEGEVVSESTALEDLQLDILTVSHVRRASGSPSTTELDGRGPYLDFVRTLPEAATESASARPSYVRLGLSLAVIREKTRRSLLVMAGLTLVFTVFGGVVAFGLYSAILRPLEKVVASIHRLAVGDLRTRVDVRGYDELEDLASSFNQMAAVIDRRNREIQEVNRELRSANEAKTEFLAMVGHDLKTPLHSVRGYCQILLEELDGPLTDEQRADVVAILTAGNHLLSLIDNILAFSASGADQLQLTQVSLPALIEQAANHVRPLAMGKGLSLEVDAGATGEVEADETKLKQIVTNLLHNAVKYTPSGRVRATAFTDARGFFIEIVDTGPGIPASEREGIFEPFRRMGSGRDRKAEGLGLGLAIVRRYVTAHGGTVTLDTHPGGGSTFTVFIPEPGRGTGRGKEI